MDAVMRLNQLSDRPGARKGAKRVGRGIASGTGKTAGRGTKGQKSRSGVAIKGFEGGQMPLHRRLPKRGFSNIFARDFNVVNVGRVQQAVDAGKLDATSAVTAEALKAAGVVSKLRDGVRLLGRGEISTRLSFEVAGASKSAIAAVARAGGSVTVLQGKAPPARTGKRTLRREAARQKREARAAGAASA
jgi:large subunit ribosomal protein L15